MCAMRERVVLTVIAVVAALVVLGVGALFVGHRPQATGGSGGSVLPALNASLNALSAGLLTAGWLFIRRRRIAPHRACMLGALGVSALFLASYVAYHYAYGSRPFGGQGWIRWVYFPLLISHVVLAATIVPLALVTVYRALAGDLERHRRVARRTLPIWLYVSVTGVLVYALLYGR
jgi:putative membrane protein